MEAKELMIGDRVLLDGIPKRLTLWDIVYISRGTYGAEPIPLTEDMMKANGWSVEDFSWACHGVWYYTSGLYVSFASNKDENGFEVENIYDDEYLVFYCQYVHELQHALRLCNLEHLAESFKLE